MAFAKINRLFEGIRSVARKKGCDAISYFVLFSCIYGMMKCFAIFFFTGTMVSARLHMKVINLPDSSSLML